ncbi:hypothetical protein [Kribbella sp. NPDC049227]|uniref:hypothetical protein n=1 Tax=Kribbella sp. NPDC049227 TaxID=3364113 RepID=UPI00371992F1
MAIKRGYANCASHSVSWSNTCMQQGSYVDLPDPAGSQKYVVLVEARRQDTGATLDHLLATEYW